MANVNSTIAFLHILCILCMSIYQCLYNRGRYPANSVTNSCLSYNFVLIILHNCLYLDYLIQIKNIHINDRAMKRLSNKHGFPHKHTVNLIVGMVSFVRSSHSLSAGLRVFMDLGLSLRARL